MASEWSPPTRRCAFLSQAQIEVDDEGRTLVIVDGAPLFAYPSVAEFLDAWQLRDADIERAPTRVPTTA